MTNHPMLLMRDPPPEIDVTRPVLPRSIETGLRVVVDRAATDGDKTVEMTYTVECGVIKVHSITESAAPAHYGNGSPVEAIEHAPVAAAIFGG